MWLTPFKWREFLLIGFLSWTLGYFAGWTLATMVEVGWLTGLAVGMGIALVLLGVRELGYHGWLLIQRRRRSGRHRLRIAEVEYLDWIASLCGRIDEDRAKSR